MLIVHFSKSACAGSPIRLVNAINKHTQFSARLIDLDRFGYYPHDIISRENIDEAVEIANKADIIHLHHYIDIDSNEFQPINFRELKNKGILFIRQYRASPDITAENAGVNIKDIYNPLIPSLAVGQYMERFYPDSMVVPNIIPENEPLYLPNNNKNDGVFFSPTFKHSAWTQRWLTKASPEINKILDRLRLEKDISIKSFKSKKSLDETLKIKNKSEIIIDDLITGSYHISSLEGLSMGKPVLSYLDNRTQFVLSELSSSNECPLVNVRFEEAYESLSYMVDNKNIIRDIGLNSRKWFEKYWSEKKMIKFYVKAYKILLDNPEKIQKQENLIIKSEHQKYFSILLPDIIYKSRFDSYMYSASILERINHKSKKIFFNIKKYLKVLLG